MSSPKVTLNDYQNQTNVRGLITTNQISHAFRPEPSLNTHPVQASICDGKPLEIVLKNPLPLHDTYVTTNNLYHGLKFHELEHRQPMMHLLSPSLTRIHYTKPDFHRKVAKGDFNLKPIYDKSETHEQFRAKFREHDIYGSPKLHISHRDVYLPLGKDSVFEFDRDEPYSVLRMSHPYLSTYQMAHRRFSPEEIEKYRALDALECGTVGKKGDVRIKMKVRPMLDILEQRVRLDNLDSIKDNPSNRYWTGQKGFFRKGLYKGCPPRAFPPVQHYGWHPTTEATYSFPYSASNKSNFTNPVKVCYGQPKHAASSAMKVPHMYTKESSMYGSGKNVASFINVGNLGICGDTCVP